MTLFLLCLLSIIFLLITLIIFSTLKIEVVELEIINTKINKINLKIILKLFGKIKWLQISINKNKINKLSRYINKIWDKKINKEYTKIKDIALNNWKIILKNLEEAIEIEKLNFNAQIGTKNAVSTAYITSLISSIIAILIARKVPNPKYSIEPIYMNKNHVHLSINCIIAIKLAHIINIRKDIKRKEVYQKYGRTSNRRPYANSNG